MPNGSTQFLFLGSYHGKNMFCKEDYDVIMIQCFNNNKVTITLILTDLLYHLLKSSHQVSHACNWQDTGIE